MIGKDSKGLKKILEELDLSKIEDGCIMIKTNKCLRKVYIHLAPIALR